MKYQKLSMRRKRQRGSVVVEFAIVSVFLTVMLFGIVQYGIIFNATNTFVQLTREAGRYAAVHYTDTNFNKDELTSGSLKWYIKKIDQGNTIPFADIVFPTTPVNYYSPTSGQTGWGAGNPITITMQYDLSKKYFMPGFIPGTRTGPVMITKTATTLME